MEGKGEASFDTPFMIQIQAESIKKIVLPIQPKSLNYGWSIILQNYYLRLTFHVLKRAFILLSKKKNI